MIRRSSQTDNKTDIDYDLIPPRVFNIYNLISIEPGCSHLTGMHVTDGHAMSNFLFIYRLVEHKFRCRFAFVANSFFNNRVAGEQELHRKGRTRTCSCLKYAGKLNTIDCRLTGIGVKLRHYC